MKKHILKHKRLLGTVGVAILLLLVPLKAQFLGIGSLVFDPTSFLKLAQQYTQIMEALKKIVSHPSRATVAA